VVGAVEVVVGRVTRVVVVGAVEDVVLRVTSVVVVVGRVVVDATLDVVELTGGSPVVAGSLDAAGAVVDDVPDGPIVSTTIGSAGAVESSPGYIVRPAYTARSDNATISAAPTTHTMALPSSFLLYTYMTSRLATCDRAVGTQGR
jgi:hypothetical protein